MCFQTCFFETQIVVFFDTQKEIYLETQKELLFETQKYYAFESQKELLFETQTEAGPVYITFRQVPFPQTATLPSNGLSLPYVTDPVLMWYTGVETFSVLRLHLLTNGFVITYLHLSDSYLGIFTTVAKISDQTKTSSRPKLRSGNRAAQRSLHYLFCCFCF